MFLPSAATRDFCFTLCRAHKRAGVGFNSHFRRLSHSREVCYTKCSTVQNCQQYSRRLDMVDPHDARWSIVTLANPSVCLEDVAFLFTPCATARCQYRRSIRGQHRCCLACRHACRLLTCWLCRERTGCARSSTIMHITCPRLDAAWGGLLGVVISLAGVNSC